jgi:hypothetical protein
VVQKDIQVMLLFKMIHTLLSDIVTAYNLYEAYKRDKAEIAYLQIALKEARLWVSLNAVTDLGYALEVADAYSIKLSHGLTRRDCGAVLQEKYWQAPINPNVKSAEFGSFMADRSHEDIHAIGGLSHDVRFAICRCLINAYKAGVIRK